MTPSCRAPARAIPNARAMLVGENTTFLSRSPRSVSASISRYRSSPKAVTDFETDLASAGLLGARATADVATSSPAIGGSARASQGWPSWSAIATQPWSTPSDSANETGVTSYQTYPEALTGPPTTRSSVPSGRRGSYLIEASLTSGADRTRRRSETVTTTEPRNASAGDADGLATGEAVAAGVAWNAVGEAVGETAGVGVGVAEPQLATNSTTSSDTRSTRWRRRMSTPPAGPRLGSPVMTRNAAALWSTARIPLVGGTYRTRGPLDRAGNTTKPSTAAIPARAAATPKTAAGPIP